MVPKAPLGMTLIAVGIALPVIAYVAGHLFNMEVASRGGPPNQGAMVVAYLLFQGALIFGACVALIGLIVMMKPPKKPFNAKIDNTR